MILFHFYHFFLSLSLALTPTWNLWGLLCRNWFIQFSLWIFFSTLFKKDLWLRNWIFWREREIYWRFLNSSDQLLSIYYLTRIRFLFLKCIKFRNGMAHINIRQEKRTSEWTRVNKTEHPKRKIFEYNKIHVGTCRERASVRERQIECIRIHMQCG